MTAFEILSIVLNYIPLESHDANVDIKISPASIDIMISAAGDHEFNPDFLEEALEEENIPMKVTSLGEKIIIIIER